jgi:chalcone isomerase-like protein
MKRLLAAILVALFAGTALAVEVGGVKLDDRVALGGQDLVLNGAGIRTRVFVKVYVGSLYVPAKAGDAATVLAKGPRRVQLNLLRNVAADTFVEALVDGLKENSTEQELAAMKPQTDEMVSIMKSFGEVKEGSVVTLDFVDGATKIGFNGAMKGAVAGEAFNRALLKIWLGDKPIQADLKKAMLGG